MPVYDFLCNKCKAPVRTMTRTPKSHNGCGGSLERNPSGAAAQQYDTLDNGVMPKRIERLTNIEELVHERASNDPRITRYQD